LLPMFTQTKLPASIWLMRIVWLAMPFTAGRLLAAGLADSEPSFRAASSVGLWVIWGVVTLLAWLLHPTTLGWLRVWMPAGLAAICWASIAAPGELADLSWAETASGVAATAAAAVVCLTPPVGMAYTDSLNYPSERRLLLRPPAILLWWLLLPVWAVAVGGMLAGPLLLASQNWLAGGIVTPVGILLSFRAHQSLLILTRRWLVFVPAGIVIHDSLALGNEARLLETADIAKVSVISAADRRSQALGPGEANPGDLTLGALGAAVEFELSSPCSLPDRKLRQLAARPRQPEAGQTVGSSTIRLAPSLLRQFVQEASRRGIIQLPDADASVIT